VATVLQQKMHSIFELCMWHPIVFLTWNQQSKCAQMKPIQNLILEKALCSA